MPATWVSRPIGGCNIQLNRQRYNLCNFKIGKSEKLGAKLKKFQLLLNDRLFEYGMRRSPETDATFYAC